MKYQVYKTVKHPGISNANVQNVIEKTLKIIKKKNWDVSVHFIGNTRMRTLNRRYRGKDSSTDVLSFAANEGESFIPENKDLGDIFLAVPYIKAQAKRFKVSYKEEVVRMLVHGILHLAGYDHQTKKQAKQMFTLQESLVSKCL